MSYISLLRSLRLGIGRRSNIGLNNVVNVCFHKRDVLCNVNKIHLKKFSVSHRMMATSALKNIDINELKHYQKDTGVTIIDVREDSEIKETGILPGAIHIPLGDIAKALQEEPSTFQKKYHHSKPSKDSPIIFSCRSGKRSLTAASKAESLGYKNIMNYAGGWLDWESNLPK